MQVMYFGNELVTFEISIYQRTLPEDKFEHLITLMWCDIARVSDASSSYTYYGTSLYRLSPKNKRKGWEKVHGPSGDVVLSIPPVSGGDWHQAHQRTCMDLQYLAVQKTLIILTHPSHNYHTVHFAFGFEASPWYSRSISNIPVTTFQLISAQTVMTCHCVFC